MSQKMLIVLATAIVALHLSQNVAGLTPSKTLLVTTKDSAEIEPEPESQWMCYGDAYADYAGIDNNVNRPKSSIVGIYCMSKMSCPFFCST